MPKRRIGCPSRTVAHYNFTSTVSHLITDPKIKASTRFLTDERLLKFQCIRFHWAPMPTVNSANVSPYQPIFPPICDGDHEQAFPSLRKKTWAAQRPHDYARAHVHNEAGPLRIDCTCPNANLENALYQLIRAPCRQVPRDLNALTKPAVSRTGRGYRIPEPSLHRPGVVR